MNRNRHRHLQDRNFVFTSTRHPDILHPGNYDVESLNLPSSLQWSYVREQTLQPCGV